MRERRGRFTCRDTEGASHVMAEARMGGKWSQIKEHQRLLATLEVRKGQGKILF